MPEQPQTPAPGALPAFSLALLPQRVLPTALLSAADGKLYPIDADFRTVLACLRRLEDPERDALQKRLTRSLCLRPCESSKRWGWMFSLKSRICTASAPTGN